LVLAVLLIEAGKVISIDQLVNEIWGEQPPGTAAVMVRGYVCALRRTLGGGTHGTLLTRGHGYELVVADEDVDARVFERLVDTGVRAIARGDRGDALTWLSEALALCRGQVLADVPSSGTVATEITRLEQRRLTAMEERLGALLDLGRHAEMVDTLAQVVAEHPLRERLQGQLMLALYRCGRRAEALATYRSAHRKITEELGVEPGMELRRLHRAMLADEPHLVAPVRQATQNHRVTPAQLPAEVTAFTGRESPLRRLDTLLPNENDPDGDAGSALPVIATIVGTAGIGKTALALRWAHQVRRRFPDGQLYVNMRGYAAGPPMRPIDALARFLPELGVPAEQVPLEVDVAASLYRSLLADKRILVLLDNVAHSDQVRPLLPGSRGCLVLLTSRDKLGGLVARDGAVPLTLDALDPAESMTLLTRLLGADRVDTEPDAAAALTDLCGHLPLALRIAAANLTARPTHAIADYTTRLAGGDRLAALQMDGDPQAAVRAAFDHSYATLPNDAALLFRLLGLVPGTEITAPAAAALADFSLPQATRLLDRLARGHLIVELTRDRYTLHDLLRLYAADLAARDGALDRRAALNRLYDHYLRGVQAAAMRLYPHVLRLPVPEPIAAYAGDHAEALAWLDAELPNLMAAISHAAAHGPHAYAWQLTDALRGYLFMRMPTVTWNTVGHAGLAAARTDGDLRAQSAAHLSLATLTRAAGRNLQAIRHYQQAIVLAERTGWLDGCASTLGNLGLMRWVSGQPEEAIDHFNQAIAIARRTGRLAAEAANLRRLGLTYWGLGKLELSADHLTQAIDVHRRTESRSGEARTLAGLGEAQRALGRLDDALDTLTQTLALHRTFGDRNREADTLRLLATVHRDASRPDQALELATTALALARETGNRPNEADALNTLATIQVHLGRPEQAIHHHRHALGLARGTGNRHTETEALAGLAAAYHAAGHHDQAAEAAGAALTIARRCHFRLLESNVLTTLAAIRLHRGTPEEAVDHAERALALHTETGHRLGQARSHLVVEQAMRRAGRDHEAHTHHDLARTLLTKIGADLSYHTPCGSR
jgi:DNA-binding SARP family transcriptional activator/Tfp pilus assembly protein PilF